jgi:hypothetical protein
MREAIPPLPQYIFIVWFSFEEHGHHFSQNSIRKSLDTFSFTQWDNKQTNFLCFSCSFHRSGLSVNGIEISISFHVVKRSGFSA